MIKFRLHCLRVFGVCMGLLACRHQEAVAPVTRSTDQIARITEQLGESMFSTQYQYDQQGRLIRQTVDGFIEPGDYGRRTSTIDYTFVYEPAQLIMTYAATTTEGAQTYHTQSVQRIPLNKQGLVRYSPRFFCMDCGRGDYGTVLGMSDLLYSAINPAGPGDTLRQYDAEGYLIQAERLSSALNSTSAYGAGRRVKQTVNRGNISQLQGLDTVISPPASVTYQSAYTYDATKAGLRNPYQFMGTTNLNLMQTKSGVSVTSNQSYRTEYTYAYDKKGRVAAYTITSGNPGAAKSPVNSITYTNP